ncbi:MAG: MBL fold hydrolase [Candidatus Levybacteria bacterium CG10_big_fil_rev_8_21_14_0_10_36_7]|nr:MAG: MBL fold hydrolase [Candidatus Levybacteria bacterium CG10_big_fil_rev_8_21_14_0_10_36_7]
MLKLTFHGGASGVTGANYLLEDGKTRILIDCGLFQGAKFAEDDNRKPFAYDVSTIDALFATHAHIDHIGRVPKLVKDGFRGKIYSTPPTRDFAQLMLLDSMGVMKKESRDPLYTKVDVEKAMGMWEKLDYQKEIKVGGFNLKLREAGHILGSAMVEITHDKTGKKIVFTGDLGNMPNPLLRDTDEIKDVDYLIIESAYGDRCHGGIEQANLKLERVIEDTVQRKGVLMIPAFSLERTQKLLFEINELVEHGRIPRVPIFLDSPLAIKATAIYKQYKQYYSGNAKKVLLTDDDLFNFPGLQMTLETEESKAINQAPSPKIIMAGSGMSVGGRIIHHEKHYLGGENNTLLLIGYQADRTLGRKLFDGEKYVKIAGQDVAVKAHIEMVSGYSAHADQEDLFQVVNSTKNTLKKVFVVQGDEDASKVFAVKVRDELGVDARVPKVGNIAELD